MGETVAKAKGIFGSQDEDVSDDDDSDIDYTPGEGFEQLPETKKRRRTRSSLNSSRNRLLIEEEENDEEEEDDDEEEEEEATSTTASRNNNICNGEEEHPDRNQSKKKGKQVVVATQSSPRFTPHRQASPKSRQISRNNRTIPAMTTKFSILEPHEAQANPNSSVIVRGFIERIEFRNFEDFLTFFQKVKSN